MPDLRIGVLAGRTGTNAPTIRYYEEIGLLPPAARGDSGQRGYGEEDVRRLTFIRRCRDLGLAIDKVRALTTLMGDPARSCLEARDLAKAHLAATRAKLAELKALEAAMAGFVTDCEALCAGGSGPDCAVLENLAEPSERQAAKPKPMIQP